MNSLLTKVVINKNTIDL